MSRSTRGPIRVLHVDDDPEVLDLTATFLEREDDRFSVETATSATEGRDRLDDDSVDCVVSDYDMPGTNGIQFLEAVRRDDADLPFILFTGKGSEEVASDAISAGVTDYLQKESGTEQYAILANRILNSVERTRAERQRQQHLEAIETAREGISILDDDGRFTYVNEAYADLYGYTPAELVGEHWEMLYREADAGEIHDEILPQVEATGHWHGETTGRRADGTTFVEDHTLAITANGDLICTVRDVSGRKRRERQFRAIFDNSYTFMGLLDPDGTVIEANETALSMGGLEREAVVGNPLWDTPWFRTNETSRAAVEKAVERASEGDSFRDTVRVQADDRELVLDFSVRPVTDDRGELRLLVPEGRDVTELTERTRRLETLIDTLPGMVYRCRNERGWPIEEVGGEVEALTGYSPSALESRTGVFGTEIIHPDDQDAVWSVVQEALDRGDSFELSYRIVTKDGDTKWVYEQGEGIYSPDGDLEALEGFVTDVAERPPRLDE